MPAIPFAIWFYLAIEGVANMAEEVKNPQRDLSLGFNLSMATLAVLALLVFFGAIGVAGWQSVVFPPGKTAPSDSPLPLAPGAATAHAAGVVCARRRTTVRASAIASWRHLGAG